MSRRNPSKTPKVTQHRGGFRNLMGKAGNASAPDTPNKPSRWRRSNFYQKLDLAMGGTAVFAGVGYALFQLGQHIAFLASVSAFLSPFAQMLLGIVVVSACVMLLSAAIQAWRNNEGAAEDNMRSYEEASRLNDAAEDVIEVIEQQPATGGGAHFSPVHEGA